MRITIVGNNKVKGGLGALLDRIVPHHKGFASMMTDGLPLLHRLAKLSENLLIEQATKSNG